MHTTNFERGILVQPNDPPVRYRATKDCGMQGARRFVVINKCTGTGQEPQILRAFELLANQSIRDNRHYAIFCF